MVKGKAPGLVGFTINFFHHCWDLLKHEVLEIVEESRQKHWVLPSLNATFFMLIPKETGATDPGKFRPISLCNVIYKIISKVIASRLKGILPFLISPEQTGYVEGRQILYGIILAHEVLHSLKTTKTPRMLLNLDLSKCFDKLNWGFIRQMLLAFGFSPNWTNWVLSLISSAFFSILVNGYHSTTFSPSIGIRQGYPLSPFIFILMVEGLGRMIKSEFSSRMLRGIYLHDCPLSPINN